MTVMTRVLLVTLLQLLACTSAQATEWYAPAYTEPQEAIYLLATEESYVRVEHFASGPTTPMEVQAQIAQALHPHVQVRVLVQPGSTQEKAFLSELEKLGVKYPSPNITFLNVAHCDIWARDTGPIWVKRNSSWMEAENTSVRESLLASSRKMVQPIFSLWGYVIGDNVKGPWASCDVPNRVPEQLSPLLGIPYVVSNFTTEGGDKSFNGRGTVLMNKAVETQRNPKLSLEGIEALAKKELHVQHIVWTEQGVADDEQSFRGPQIGAGGKLTYTSIGTGGHVDEFARFVGPHTVLLAQVDERQRKASPMMETTYNRLERNNQLLLGQKDQDGNPLQVIRMPFPDELTLTIDQNDSAFGQLAQLPALNLTNATASIDIVLAASYTNYIIANGVVVVPKYYKPGRSINILELDNKARDTLQRIFPERKVVQINPEPVNAGGGGLNCISNNQPA